MQEATPPPPVAAPRAPLWLTVPSAVAGLLALLPVAYLAVRAGEEGWATVEETLRQARTRELLINSVTLTAAVTASATVLGVALAWMTSRVRLPFRPLWPALAALPLAIPTYVAALTWISTFPGLAGFPGAWIVLTLYSYPYVYLPVAAALRRIDPSLEEASRSLGVGGLRTFLRVTVPQVRPAVVAGALLVALYALSDFGAVSIMRYDAFTRGIYTSYQASFDRTPAAILGACLVVLTLVIVVAEARTRGRGRRSKVGSGAVRAGSQAQVGHLRWLFAFGAAAVAALTLGLPAVVLGSWFSEGLSSTGAFSGVWTYVRNSIGVSLAGATATVLAALPVGILAARYSSRLSGAVERAAYVGHALPGIVIALSLVFFATRYAAWLYQELPLLVVAYVVLFIPLAVGAIHASASQAPPVLDDVARSLGRRPFRVLMGITIPLTLPGVAAGAALVFLTCMKELPATLLLQPTGFDTLATRVWTETNSGAFAAASVPAVLLVVAAAIPTYLLAARGKTET